MHNRKVMRSPRRAVFCHAIAAGLVLSSVVAPPQHLHEADAEHSHSVIHRHFEAHDHDGAEISHGEGRVVWLDDVGIRPATHEFTGAQTILSVQIDSLPEPSGWIAVARIETAPPHGPPRTSYSLRAPPPSC